MSRLHNFRKLPCAFCRKQTSLARWARWDGRLTDVPCCRDCEAVALPFVMPEQQTAYGTRAGYTITADRESGV
jgi:hypothetical protein